MNSKMCATTNRAKSWESIDFSLAESYVKKTTNAYCESVENE